jgi:predicted TPR repeat methyltransferase
VVPFAEMVKWAQEREALMIGDFGCGEALFGKAVSDRHVVHSLNHVAINERAVPFELLPVILRGEKSLPDQD